MSIKTFDVISLGKVNLMNPEQLGYQDSLGIIRDELHRTKRSFVKIGWYLKHILKNEMYKEDGYANIYELASDKFNLSQATATRFMQICEQFSIGHDSPELDEKYIDFNMSQLFEMLPMNQEDMEKVTPGMKVSDIRKFKKENKELSEKKSDEDNIPGQTSIEKDFREFMPDSNQNNADDDVSNGESNVYATSHKENDSCSVDLMDKDKIIDGEYREIKAPENEEENPVPLPEDGIAITRYILEQEKKNLDDILKVDKVEKLPEMMDRMTEKWNGGYLADIYDEENDDGGLGHVIPLDNVKVELLIQKLGGYEDLEEQGLLLKLPCAIGSDVYFIPSKVNFDLNKLNGHEESNRVYHQKVFKIVFTERGWYLECDKDLEYGTGNILLDKFYKETWFLTQAEAEEALERMGREE